MGAKVEKEADPSGLMTGRGRDRKARMLDYRNTCCFFSFYFVHA